MKRITTILTMLMLVCMGAWAATSPAAGAYPVEGKTYYLFANQYGGTNRYYLYWDNTNSVLKHATANSKENNDYYKWTVTRVSEGVYTITNVGTEKKLTWSSGLTLGDSGKEFTLSQSVNYTACVSLYTNTEGGANGNRWCCVKYDTETFASGYKFSSFPNDQSQYGVNFVFEEVLDAHSLTNGSYYTIYCDNDNKQYMYDNSGTLAQTSTTPTAASSDYIWKCIVNGDYYNFQNVATGKYLGFRAISSSAVNFAVETADVYHDGCVKLKQGSNYMGWKTGGATDQASHPRFPKITTDYSFDYRFDEITPTYGTAITDLASLSNSKAYVITNARASWNFADDATSMTAVAGHNLADKAQQIAIINHEGNYYLFSVNAGKYLTASNTLTSMPTDAEQVDIVATEDETYPWFFRFKTKDGENKYTKNINVTGTPAVTIDGWGPGGSNPDGCLDGGNCNAIIEAAAFDATSAIAMFSTRSVNYTLQWSDGTQIGETVSGVTVAVSGDAADFVPTAFENDFVTLSYSPATIASETTEVTVTATWNGPFQISSSYASAQWQVVQMHTYQYGGADYAAEKWSWSYKSDDSNKVKPEQVLDFEAVTTNRLFCFVGNPYTGFKIYNAAAGSGYTLCRTGESDEIAMAASENIFTIHTSDVKDDVTTYFTLKPSGATNYVNFDYTNKQIIGYSDADNGSTCWVVAPGQYYLDFIDALNLSAPVGAVGTNSYFTTSANPASAKSSINSLRSTVASNMYSNELGSVNSYLTPIKPYSTITLADGYYRIVSALSNFSQDRAMIFDPSLESPSTSDISASIANKIVWSMLDNSNVGNIFRISESVTEGKYYIYSPNKQEYLSANDGSTTAAAANLTLAELGSSQYNITAGSSAMHAQGWNWTGTYGTQRGQLVQYDGGAGSPSAWYIVMADDVEITLNNGGDGNYYATMCLPFDVTISGADAYTMVQSGDWMVPKQLEDNEVPAGTAVLLKGSSASATATINTGSAFSTSNANDLLGVYVPTGFALDETADDENDDEVSCTSEYFLGVYNGTVGFYRSGYVSKTVDDVKYYTLGANKAYLGNAAASRGFAIKWSDDDVTGIRAINNGKQAQNNGVYYDLSGRRVENPQHGMYIVNGKKVVIK